MAGFVGSDAIALQKGVMKAGDRVLIVDDLLVRYPFLKVTLKALTVFFCRLKATGGTAGAACKLVQEVGAVVAEVSVFIELTDLNGVKKLPEGTKLWSMYQF